ncbi:ATP-dependent helicase [Thermocaproicibacter melissae]|uniref:ATP-dependent helicase n=1 Tax=Thermocaproicibacter melissae TaxID=2966552 RepID=UPI0024B24AED|nr:UvrD-helicase domain-containing protein [Thermocaproicibacter melissae]WBY64919.1 3'-5' exonuclease [Thermocaproicibacter melissae]
MAAWNEKKLLELRRRVLEQDFQRMNDKQKEAVFHVNGPLLILAGAGSGKTTVLVNRAANIVRYGNAYHSNDVSRITDEVAEEAESYLTQKKPIPDRLRSYFAVDPCEPWRILAITFTNKAANELKERLSAMLGSDDGEQIWASTFHATCARMLRRDGDKIGYSKHFTIYDTDDSKRLIKECQKTLNIDDKKISYKTIMSEISHAKDNLIGPDEYYKSAGRDPRLAKIGELYRMYQKRLKDADAMDFDDLIMKTIELFRAEPEVLDYYHRRFRYIMVDEYQDTSHAQYELVRLLTGESGNLCVVGDDDQSIYQFRGATIENILSFEKTFPSATVIRLEQNYRSTKTILNAANAVIANNENRKGKTLWTKNDQGKKIDAYTAASEEEEASYIADTILEGVAKGRKFSDYAVLYRMNSQSNTLERVFTKSSIPHRVLGGHRFFDRKEIRDMIAYLSVISNPNDEARLLRIINSPKRAIGEKTVATAQQIASGIGEPLFYVLEHADEYEPLKRSSQKLMAFANMIRELSDAAAEGDKSLAEIYGLLLEKTGYIEALAASGEEDAQDRIDNVNELTSHLIRFSEENGEDATLEDYLAEVQLLTDIDNYDETADSVVMMTMHSAKGLEFPVVFLPGFEEGIFPGMQVMFNPSQVEEERRLAYVAITRAKEELHIVNALRRMLFGSTQSNRPSRFLDEIPKEIVEFRTSDRLHTYGLGSNSFTSFGSSSHSVFPSAAQPKSFGFPPAASTPQPKSSVSFQKGDKVFHKTFGLGTVLSASPMGNDTLLEISFERVGKKKLMANFARLEKR